MEKCMLIDYYYSPDEIAVYFKTTRYEWFLSVITAIFEIVYCNGQ